MIKFKPPIVNDSMYRDGNWIKVSTHLQCITCMKEYENKSLEELRAEHYALNSKGNAANTFGCFGGVPLHAIAHQQTGLFHTAGNKTSENKSTFDRHFKRYHQWPNICAYSSHNVIQPASNFQASECSTKPDSKVNSSQHFEYDPEHLDGQIRSLSISQDSLVQSFLRQHKILLKLKKSAVEALKKDKDAVEQLKEQLKELNDFEPSSSVTPEPSLILNQKNNPFMSQTPEVSEHTNYHGLSFSKGQQLPQFTFNPHSSASTFTTSSSQDVHSCTGIRFAPDNVVKTVEENEEVLFEDRAKLYSFVDHEWKKRAIGVVKILYDEGSSKVRLLMRHDQVLKVCANHDITSNMEILPLNNSDKAWTWVAPDFVDGKLHPELFCIHFKTPEIASAFKTAFEKAISISKNAEAIKVTCPKMSISTVTLPLSQKPFNGKFLPKADSWTYPTCYVSNTGDKSQCIACETKMSGFQASTTSVTSSVKSATVTRIASSSESAAGPKSPAVAATSSQLSTINGTSEKINITSNQSAKQNISPAFVFSKTIDKSISLPNKVKSSRSQSNKPESLSVSVSNKGRSVFTGAPGEFIQNVEFKPVVPLPALVDAKTGDENEEKIFGERALLFRFNSESNECDTGEILILFLKESHRYKVLMRQEKVLKICANHYILPEMKLAPLNDSDTAWIWIAQDYSEGLMTQRKLAVKFKNYNIARQFYRVFKKCQNHLLKYTNNNQSNPCSDNKNVFDKLLPTATKSWTCIKCSKSNMNCTSCVNCQTIHNKITTLVNAVPALDKRSSNCPKSVKDVPKQRDASKTTQSGNTSVVLPDQTNVPLSELFKPEDGSMKCDTCFVHNKINATNCVSSGPPKPSTTSAPQLSFGKLKFGNNQAPSFGLGHSKSNDFEFGMKLTTQPTMLNFGLTYLSNKLGEVKTQAGSWECDTCLVQNKADATKCVSCETSKPGTTSVSLPSFGKFDFDSNPTPSFGFGHSRSNDFQFGMKPTMQPTMFNFGLRDLSNKSNAVAAFQKSESVSTFGTSTQNTDMPKNIFGAVAEKFEAKVNSDIGFGCSESNDFASGMKPNTQPTTFSFGRPDLSNKLNEFKPSFSTTNEPGMFQGTTQKTDLSFSGFEAIALKTDPPATIFSGASKTDSTVTVSSIFGGTSMNTDFSLNRSKFGGTSQKSEFGSIFGTSTHSTNMPKNVFGAVAEKSGSKVNLDIYQNTASVSGSTQFGMKPNTQPSTLSFGHPDLLKKSNEVTGFKPTISTVNELSMFQRTTKKTDHPFLGFGTTALKIDPPAAIFGGASKTDSTATVSSIFGGTSMNTDFSLNSSKFGGTSKKSEFGSIFGTSTQNTNMPKNVFGAVAEKSGSKVNLDTSQNTASVSGTQGIQFGMKPNTQPSTFSFGLPDLFNKSPEVTGFKPTISNTNELSMFQRTTKKTDPPFSGFGTTALKIDTPVTMFRGASKTDSTVSMSSIFGGTSMNTDFSLNSSKFSETSQKSEFVSIFGTSTQNTNTSKNIFGAVAEKSESKVNLDTSQNTASVSGSTQFGMKPNTQPSTFSFGHPDLFNKSNKVTGFKSTISTTNKPSMFQGTTEKTDPPFSGFETTALKTDSQAAIFGGASKTDSSVTISSIFDAKSMNTDSPLNYLKFSGTFQKSESVPSFGTSTQNTNIPENIFGAVAEKFEAKVNSDISQNTVSGSGTQSASSFDSASQKSGFSAFELERDLSKKFNEVKLQAESWECDTCLVHNKANATNCVSCETPKSGTISSSQPGFYKFQFGFNPAPSFGFGGSKSDFVCGMKPNTQPTAFSFGRPELSNKSNEVAEFKPTFSTANEAAMFQGTTENTDLPFSGSEAIALRTDLPAAIFGRVSKTDSTVTASSICGGTSMKTDFSLNSSKFGGTSQKSESASIFNTSTQNTNISKSIFGAVAEKSESKVNLDTSQNTASVSGTLFGMESNTQPSTFSFELPDLFNKSNEVTEFKTTISTTNEPSMFQGTTKKADPLFSGFGTTALKTDPQAAIFGGASKSDSPVTISSIFGGKSMNTDSPLNCLKFSETSQKSESVPIFGTSTQNTNTPENIFGAVAEKSESKDNPHTSQNTVSVSGTHSASSLDSASQKSGFSDFELQSDLSNKLNEVKLQAESWECDTCLVHNKIDATNCASCETPKPGTISSSQPGFYKFQFGFNPAPSFGFGGSKSNDIVCDMKPNTQPTSFSFGHSDLSNRSNEVAGFKPAFSTTNEPAIFRGTTQKMNPLFLGFGSATLKTDPQVTIFGGASNTNSSVAVSSIFGRTSMNCDSPLNSSKFGVTSQKSESVSRFSTSNQNSHMSKDIFGGVTEKSESKANLDISQFSVLGTQTQSVFNLGSASQTSDSSAFECRKDVCNKSNEVKSQAEAWECDTCLVHNKTDSTNCASCETSKPGTTSESQPDFEKFQFGNPARSFRFGDSKCNDFVFNMKPTTQPSMFFVGLTDLSNKSNEVAGIKSTFSSTNEPSLFGRATHELDSSFSVFGSKVSKTDLPASIFGEAVGSKTVKTSQFDSSMTVSSSFGKASESNSSLNSPFFSKTCETDSFLNSSIFQVPTDQKNEFNFNGVRERERPRCPPKTPKSLRSLVILPDKDEENNYFDADNIYYQPVIPVPPKVDGVYAADRFARHEYSTGNGNTLQTSSSSTDDPVCSLLQECRLMRKDELSVVKSCNTPRIPDCFQRSPHKVNIAGTSSIPTIAVDREAVSEPEKIEKAETENVSFNTSASQKAEITPHFETGKDVISFNELATQSGLPEFSTAQKEGFKGAGTPIFVNLNNSTECDRAHNTAVETQDSSSKKSLSKHTTEYLDSTESSTESQSDYDHSGSESDEDEQDSDENSLLFERRCSFEISEGKEDKFKGKDAAEQSEIAEKQDDSSSG